MNDLKALRALKEVSSWRFLKETLLDFFEVEIFIVGMGLFLLSKCVLNANACIVTGCLIAGMMFNPRPGFKNRDDT